MDSISRRLKNVNSALTLMLAFCAFGVLMHGLLWDFLLWEDWRFWTRGWSVERTIGLILGTVFFGVPFLVLALLKVRDRRPWIVALGLTLLSQVLLFWDNVLYEWLTGDHPSSETLWGLISPLFISWLVMLLSRGVSALWRWVATVALLAPLCIGVGWEIRNYQARKLCQELEGQWLSHGYCFGQKRFIFS